MIKNTGGTGCLQVTHALLGWCCQGKPHCNAGTVSFKKSAEQIGWKETSQRFIAERYIVLQESTTSRYDTWFTDTRWHLSGLIVHFMLFFSPLNWLQDISCLLTYSWVIILGLIGNSGFVLRNLCALLEVLLCYLSRVWIERDPNPLSLAIFQPLICVWGVRLL